MIWIYFKLTHSERKSSVDLVLPLPSKHSLPRNQWVSFEEWFQRFDVLWVWDILWPAPQELWGKAISEGLLGREATGLLKQSWHKPEKWQDFKGTELLWEFSGIDLTHPLGYMRILRCHVMWVLFQQKKDDKFGQSICSSHHFNIHKTNGTICTEKSIPFLHLSLLEGHLGSYLQLYLW